MKIAVVGRGDVGGGLAELWTSAGHGVTTFGHEGGDVEGSDIVVVAVPNDKVTEALGNVSGLAAQVTIDVTNVTGPRTADFDSVAHEVKSIIGGPTAKALCTVFASTYGAIESQRAKPSVLFAADADARTTVEGLIADTGFDPIFIGDLDPGARLLEDSYALSGAIFESIGAFFPRYAVPGEL